MHPEIPYLHEILLFLGASVILIPLLKHLRINPVLGFLLIGVIIGPHGIAHFLPDHSGARYLTIMDYTHIQPLAELGVVFLLFTIGLEIPLKRLWAMKRLIFGLGAAQVFITAFVIGGIAYLWGNSVPASILIGGGLALSSTAIVTKLLVDHHELATPAGQTSLGILLFQDLAVVPLLILVGIFGAADHEGSIVMTVLQSFGQAALMICAIVLVGRFVLKPIYRYAAYAQTAEIFMALTLLVVIGAAALTGMAGMSMALGAFLAGLVLSETEFNYQVEADIEPFKALLLGLFFMTVGMGINIFQILDLWWLALLSIIGLFLIKLCLTFLASWLFKLNIQRAVKTSVCLAHAGEFAFVILGGAYMQGILSEEVFQFMLIVAGLSLLMAPLQYGLATYATSFLQHLPDAEDKKEPVLKDHVIIAGLGRVGRHISHLLKKQNVPFVGIDCDGDLAGRLRERGLPVYFGNASREHVLQSLGAGRARALVISMNKPRDSLMTVAVARKLYPDLKIFARATDPNHVKKLEQAGVDVVIMETFEMSLQLSHKLLQEYDIPLEVIDEQIAEMRDEVY